MINITNLSYIINNKTILSHVSCAFKPGTVSALMGKSGTGKTTLLKAIAGLIPSQGSIFLNDKPIESLSSRQRAQDIGFVFQQFNLFEHYTALQNCIDPLLIRKIAPATAQKTVYSILSQLNMDAYANNYPSQLSGGQQQRIAIARALCLSPKVLLLDEPTASLDPANSAILASILKQLATQGLTIIFSSQDMRFVQSMADTIYFLQDGTITETLNNKSEIERCPQIKQWLS